jgi:hypothetical protein
MKDWKERFKYFLKDVRCCYNCRFSTFVMFEKDRICKKDLEDWRKVQSNGFCSQYKPK